MEQKINLFLQNLRRLLDEKMQSGSNTTYGQSAALTDEQFEQVITDFGRLSREELVQLLTPIYTSPDWGNLIAVLTERIVSDVIITGTGERAEISYRTGNKTITQKIQETAPANTTTDTTTTGPVGTDSPGMDPDFDPDQTGPNDSTSAAAIGANANTPQTTTPSDVNYAAIQAILAKYQSPTISPEELNRWNAWYTWYKQRFDGLYDPSTDYTVDGHPDRTVLGTEMAIFAALIAADSRTGITELDPVEYTESIIERPAENTLRVTIQSQSVDSRGNTTTIPQTIDIVIQNAEVFSKLMESGLVNSLGKVDGDTRVIELYPGSWIELRDALRSPAMLGIDASSDMVQQLTQVYTQLVGEVNQYNPLSPRDNQLPALSAELLRTGLSWSYDHVNQRHELIDLLPWIGPSPTQIRWIPLDPNQIDGPGTWEIDQAALDDEMGIGKSLDEGVPTSVRPWLQAVLNAGGDLTIIDQAFPEGDETGARQAGIIKHWVGYILGQARLASDPRYAKQPVSIPMGAGVPPLQVGQFDLAYPGFTASTMAGYDYGMGARAGLATGASEILGAGATWQERWANAQSLGQMGAAGREGSWPPLYRAASGDTAGQATIGGVPVTSGVQDGQAATGGPITASPSTGQGSGPAGSSPAAAGSGANAGTGPPAGSAGPATGPATGAGTQSPAAGPTGPAGDGGGAPTGNVLYDPATDVGDRAGPLVPSFMPGEDTAVRVPLTKEQIAERAAIDAYEAAMSGAPTLPINYDPTMDPRLAYTPPPSIRTEGLGDLGNIESLAPVTIQGNPTNLAGQVISRANAEAANDQFVEDQFNDYLLGQGMNPEGVTGVNAVRAYNDFVQQQGPQATNYGFPAVEDTTASELGGPVGMTGQPGSMTFPQTQKAQIGPLSQTQANYNPADPAGLGQLGNVEQVRSRPSMADIRAQDLSLQQTPQEAWRDYIMEAGQVGGQEDLTSPSQARVDVPPAPTYDTSAVVPQPPPSFGEGFGFTPINTWPPSPTNQGEAERNARARQRALDAYNAEYYGFGSEVSGFGGVGYTGGPVDPGKPIPKPKPVQEQSLPYPPGHRLYRQN